MSRRVSRPISPLLRFSPLVSLLTLGACASVLGIEDISSGPAPGAAGDDGSGNSSSGGDGSTGGKGGGGKTSTPEGGSDSVAGEGPINGAGSGNEAGGINVPVGGEGGGGNIPADHTVTGKVVDFFGNPVANATLQIGEDTTSSDADGEFTFENVPGEYEISALVKREGNGKWYGWVYQGLTRRDPTLQVYQGRDSRYCQMELNTTGATPGANDVIISSIGSADGNSTYEDVDPSVGSNDYHDWEGGATTQGTAHALLFTKNAATNLPSGYKAYDSKLLALADGVSGEVTYDLSADVIASGNLTGSVVPAGEDDRTNMVFLRFASGAYIQLVEHEPTMNNFSYLVPTITGASVSVLAAEGSFYGPLGVVHKEGLNAGDATGALDIPLPPEPLTPNQTAVDPETAQFTFKASADNAGAFVVTMEHDTIYEYIYVVTTKTKFTIPSIVGGALPLRSGATYRWWVETHGDFATVDEMTGPNGFADAYSHPSFGYVPTGPIQQDGSYTFSGYFGFSVN
jgi:hypothetical protein